MPGGQVANGFVAAVTFNLPYNVALSRTVQWHTMCPIIDFMNHRSGVPVRGRCVSAALSVLRLF